MAQVVFHSVEMRGDPFAVVDERLFVVTARGNRIENRGRKIIFILEGACLHEIYDGTRRVRSQPLAPGDAFVLPFSCRQSYRALTDSAPAQIHALRLEFSPDIIPPLRWGERPIPPSGSGEPEHDFAAFVQHHLQTFRHFPGAIDREIGAVIRDLQHEAEARAPGYRLRVQGLCVGLTVLVARLYGGTARGQARSADGPRPNASHQIQQATQQFVTAHLEGDLPLAAIAASVGVSPEHLARVFKRATGQTLGEFIRQTRLERAKGLLVGTRHPVGGIAQRVGFTSPALFSRAFRAYTGTTPSAYRQRLLSDLR